MDDRPPDNPCGTCGACCRSYVVPVYGYDVWRIARAWDVPPWSFLIFFQTPAARRDAFMLDHSGSRFRLALAKQPGRRVKTAPPCIFLLRTRRGHARCALGALRPQICRSYPAECVDGVLSVRAPGCTCRSWALADLDIAAERSALDARQAEAEEYCGVIAGWNERVMAAPPAQGFDFPTFCDYVLAAYDAMCTDTAVARHA